MSQLIHIFFRHKFLIVSSFVLLSAFVFARAFFVPQLYEASVILKFENKTGPIELESEKIEIPEILQLVKNHKIKITSRPMLKRIAEKLSLTERFMFIADSNIFSRIFVNKKIIQTFCG